MQEHEEYVSAYNCFSMDITLNRMGYSHEDMDDLFEEPFSTEYPTKIGFAWSPSAIDHASINIELFFRFVLTGAATALIGKITLDLYGWAKESLKKVLDRKDGFSGSHISLHFTDIVVTVNTCERKDILDTISNVDVIIDYLKNKQIGEANYDIEFEELIIIWKKFKKRN